MVTVVSEEDNNPAETSRRFGRESSARRRGHPCKSDVMTAFAATPEPPYYAVIFTSTVTDDTDGYGAAAERMIELAREQPGFLGVESASDRGDGGLGITVSYWDSEAAISAWKAHAEHGDTRETGRTRWYSGYELRVARVERAYGWVRPD